MSIRSTIILTALVLALGVGVGLSQAGGKKHKHGVPVKYSSQQVSVPPENLEGPGVDGAIAFCPNGWKLTGGGATGDGTGFPLLINSGPAGSDGYLAIFANISDSTARMRVEAACVKSTKKSKARAQTKSRLRAQLQAEIEALGGRAGASGLEDLAVGEAGE